MPSRLSLTLSLDDDMDEEQEKPAQSISQIFKLPPEIIQQIFSYLSAEHLTSLHRTCKGLQLHATEDKLWIDLLKSRIPIHDFPNTPAPFSSFRELYLSHHPYWFLPHNKIWFSDDAYTGKLILIKFNPKRGSIEGYRVAAERPPATPEVWSYKPDVLIHHLNPHVYVSTNDPVLALSPPITTSTSSTSWNPSTEINMRIGAPTQKIDASLLLSIDLPEPTASTPAVSVWPPRTIPSMPRTRSSLSSGAADRFSSRKHKPQTLSEISQTTFRTRAWSHFTQGILNLGPRIGEAVSTWSTLSPSLYTPTPEKPYQGIFVGDYAAHGCEILLVLQTESAPISARRERVRDDARNRPSRYLSAILAALNDESIAGSDDFSDAPELADSPYMDTKEYQSATSAQVPVRPNVQDPDGQIHKGAIEAIKLTGDVNIPRGEHTFVADDIGPSGTIRIAGEKPFRGARVVKSRGHVAGRGFMEGMSNRFPFSCCLLQLYLFDIRHLVRPATRHLLTNETTDEFIPSQLFLINPDLLAQYWLPFGHISFYKRIDIDELLQNARWDERRASND